MKPWIAIICFPLCANAELIVLEDAGGRPTQIPSSALLEQYRSDKPMSGIPFKLYPQKTTLEPGYVRSRAHGNGYVDKPIFLIGDDPISKKWLLTNEAFLKSIDAVGFVSNVETVKAMEKLQSSTGLPLKITNVDAIARLFNIEKYPVLITEKEIKQ